MKCEMGVQKPSNDPSCGGGTQRETPDLEREKSKTAITSCDASAPPPIIVIFTLVQ